MKENKYLSNEEGLTLIEVLGSIVILSMIVTSFLAFFIHSARTTNVSEDVSSGLYFAQKQVEEIYHESNYYDYDGLIAKLIGASEYHQSGDNSEEFLLKKDGYQIEILITPAENDANEIIDDLYTLLVTTYDQDDTKQAQIETKFFFDEVGDDD